MDKPPIDLDRLKQLKAPKKTKEELYLEYCAAQDAEEEEQLEKVTNEHKPHPSLTDPYYYRRRRCLIDVADFESM
jgi:hypothetical protein